MIRILVTGANGFLGWHVTQQLAKTDYEIHATSRNRPLDLPLTVQFHCANLLESGVPENLIKTVRPTHLLHFAWDARPNLFWTSLENLKWVASSIELYQAFACEGGKRTVFAGSCAEYDWTYRELSENSTPLEPATLYGVCKDALRRMIESSALQNNISFAWGRLFWLYGPKEPPGRLISDLIKTLNAEEQFHCSLGLQRRDFMHVSDAASGFIQLLMSDIQGPINIASGQTHKVAEIDGTHKSCQIWHAAKQSK
jgi:nucleoside-diphosphate-sugar epimerase